MGSDAWLYSFLFYTQCIYTWVRIYTHIHTHIYIYNYICIHSHTYKIYVCIVFCKWNQKASKTRLTWLTCTGFTVNEIFIITGTFSWWNDVICCLACEAKEQKKTKVRYLQVKKLLQRQLNIQGEKRGFINLTFKLFKLYQALHICPCKCVLHWVGVSCQSNSAYPVLLNISGVHRCCAPAGLFRAAKGSHWCCWTRYSGLQSLLIWQTALNSHCRCVCWEEAGLLHKYQYQVGQPEGTSWETCHMRHAQTEHAFCKGNKQYGPR